MTDKKNVLYNYWGFLSNRIGISAPDGNASYSPWIINALEDKGFDVYGGPIDRDKQVVDKHGLTKSFAGFAEEDRIKAYTSIMNKEIDKLPSLDVLLLEWRFDTPINTLDKSDKNYSPDKDIQTKLLEKYNGKTKIVIMDLDCMLTADDLKGIENYKVITQKDISLGAPAKTLTPEMNPDIKKLMAYVGNEYMRMKDIKSKIDPLSKEFPQQISFYGNWTRDDKKEIRKQFPDIKYNGRIGLGEFTDAMGDALCVPLLAREDYKEMGFMTYRLAESLMFGSLPLGFSDFKNIDKYLPEELIVNMDEKNGLHNTITSLKNQTYEQRVELRNKTAKKVAEIFSIDNFIYEVLN